MGTARRQCKRTARAPSGSKGAVPVGAISRIQPTTRSLVVARRRHTAMIDLPNR
jgi:hypothetical protein